jgi:hypothetical protein
VTILKNYYTPCCIIIYKAFWRKIMKMYDYLIAYKFSAEGFLTSCDGTVQISRKTKIKTFADINEIVQCITDSLNNRYSAVNNVSIYNLILLGRNKH